MYIYSTVLFIRLFNTLYGIFWLDRVPDQMPNVEKIGPAPMKKTLRPTIYGLHGQGPMSNHVIGSDLA